MPNNQLEKRKSLRKKRNPKVINLFIQKLVEEEED